MKNINKQLMLIAALLFGFQVNFAQCPNNNTQYGSSSAPTTVGAPTVLSYCMYGGEYRYVYNLIAGSQYAFEYFCSFFLIDFFSLFIVHASFIGVKEEGS